MDELRSLARAILTKECPPATVRAAWGDAGLTVWPHLAKAGIVGMTAPERWGGMGLGEAELVGVLEEAGRVALPEPLLETTAVAIPYLAEHAPEAFCDRWIGGAAAGRVVIAVALGGAPFVVDAARAHLLLVERDGAIHAIEKDHARLTAETSVDRARRLFRVEWTRSLELPTSPRAFDRGALGAAAELVGLARRMIEMTVEHARTRTQFGRPIGAFQAVKHHLASAHVAVELAAACVTHAGGDPRHASLAKAQASDAALAAARASLQCHGAIGYSFEHDLHLWMKRAWALAAAWGDAAWHRARLATLVLGDSDA